MRQADPLIKSPVVRKALALVVTTIATAALGAAGALWTRVAAVEVEQGKQGVRDHFLEQGISDLKGELAAVRAQLDRKLGK